MRKSCSCYINSYLQRNYSFLSDLSVFSVFSVVKSFRCKGQRYYVEFANFSIILTEIFIDIRQML